MDSQISRRHQFLKTRDQPLTIGFVAAADFSSYIGQEYLAGIMQACADYGVHFINMADAVRHSVLEDTHFLPQFLTKTQFMRAPLVDGLVTWASSLSNYLESGKIQALFARLAPLPLVDIGYLDIPRASSIRIDNRHAMHLVIDHLVRAHGFTSLAFMGAKMSRPHALRQACFVQEMRARGLDCTAERLFLADSLDAKDVAAQTELLLERRKTLPITAVVTSSDIIAATVIETLEKHGVSVPADIAVTGFNNQLVGLGASTPITTIDLAYFSRGYRAVEVLIDHIMQPASAPEHILVQTSLVVRQSCRCFEPVIVHALERQREPRRVPPANASGADIRAYLEQVARTVLPQAEKSLQDALVAAMQEDIYDTNVPPPTNILEFFRTLLKKRRTQAFRAFRWNAAISELRAAVLPLVQHDTRSQERFENTCHALRVLYETALHYDMVAQANGSKSALTDFALSVTSAANLKQLENALRFKLSELSVPGIVLALAPYLADQLPSAHVSLVIPDPPDDIKRQLPYRVREPHLLPKKFFPHGKRFSVTLEVLFHNGKYLGYAYFLHGAENLTVYHEIQELLSQTLYQLYLKENRTKAHSLVITDREKLVQTIPLSPEPLAETHGHMQAQDILDYLIDHLDEMCSLEKMADDFHLSKSHLARRIRALTGYSMQTLHERLKIEQAKNLMKTGTLKMNDIAARLGYSNPNYFSNVFKKVTGLSPLNWIDRNIRHTAGRERVPL